MPAIRIHNMPRARRVHMGDFFDDVGNFLTHPADDASAAWTIATHPADDVDAVVSYGPQDFVNAVSSAWDAYAGGVSDIANWAAKGMSDFAKSDLGKNVLSIATGAAYMGLAPITGPLTLLIFAAPGLMRGDDFTNAWLDGMVGQASRAISALTGSDVGFDDLPAGPVKDAILSFSDTFHSQVGQATAYLQTLGAGDLANMTYDALAKQLQIRVDAAAAALVNLRNNANELAQYRTLQFNPNTGEILNAVPNAQGAAGGQLFTQVDHAAIISAMLPPDTTQNIHGAGSALTRGTSIYANLVPAKPAPAPAAVQAAQVVAALPPHQAVVATAPTHTELSTPVKAGIGAAVVGGLALALKLGGLL